MATLTKHRRLVNPGKRRKRLSPLQKLFFGSKRQRAAVANRGRNTSIRKFKKAYKKAHGHAPGWWKRSKLGPKPKRKFKRNISHIVAAYPNPGRKHRNRKLRITRRASQIKKRLMSTPIGKYVHSRNKGKKVIIVNMAHHRKANRSHRRRRNVHYVSRIKKGVYKYRNPRRRRNYTHHRPRRHNPGVVVRYRNRRVSRHHNYRRRRNPEWLSGITGRVLGVVGGIAVTKFASGFVPAQFATGFMGYIATGIIAVAQGKLIGKVSKNTQLGNDFMVGGIAYLAVKVLNDFFPSIGGYVGFSGLGLIGGSNFYVPQVPANGGGMGTFMVPGAVAGAIGAAIPANTGVGRLRRTGRLM